MFVTVPPAKPRDTPSLEKEPVYVESRPYGILARSKYVSLRFRIRKKNGGSGLFFGRGGGKIPTEIPCPFYRKSHMFANFAEEEIKIKISDIEEIVFKAILISVRTKYRKSDVLSD